ncbi:MAG: glycosyltransferase [Marinilabiliaceae bacterium]|nr:glycosyltransferase [Marinilabiliaceae bacterium]
MNIQPTISVITVVLNGIETIERTIESVINQTYNNIEYIIIDGGSNDGTQDLLKKYESRVSTIISEPDNGLYDAMNKGLKIASGDYLWFINSGDEIAEIETTQKIFENQEFADVYYGETIMINRNNQIIGKRRLTPPKKLTWKSLRNGMLISHQSIIVAKNKSDFYNINYKFSADYEWVLLVLKNSAKIVNTNMILSKFLDGGLTKKNIIKGLKERFKIMCKYYGVFSTVLFHIPIGIRFFFYYFKNKRF